MGKKTDEADKPQDIPEKIDLTLDIEDLTLDEVEEIEDITGESLDNMAAVKRGRMIKALVFVVLKRDNPDLTLEEVGEMKMGIINLGES